MGTKGDSMGRSGSRHSSGEKNRIEQFWFTACTQSYTCPEGRSAWWWNGGFVEGPPTVSLPRSHPSLQWCRSIGGARRSHPPLRDGLFYNITSHFHSPFCYPLSLLLWLPQTSIPGPLSTFMPSHCPCVSVRLPYASSGNTVTASDGNSLFHYGCRGAHFSAPFGRNSPVFPLGKRSPMASSLVESDIPVRRAQWGPRCTAIHSRSLCRAIV